MRNYLAVIFDDTGKAYKGLHALWQLDNEGLITVHGTAVVHRNDWGQFEVDTKETHPALATAVGVGVGALLGALAGPAGAAVGAAGGAAIGAGAGGVVGLTTDLVRADTRDQAKDETAFVLGIGQSAVIADVSEDSTSAIDSRMSELGGIVRRRTASTLRDDAWDDEYLPYSYLYPYEYVPPGYPLY
ncbi:MAG TPA: hypothetical protein VMW56_08155 [Candidatus Margulisiibacteriota bacterium]|nr:hypothetical protein [Candidatus Margulisiibacteriota bacterium]HVP34241.1 hypothetical protein [Steroidobacteraceae bacterium]